MSDKPTAAGQFWTCKFSGGARAWSVAFIAAIPDGKLIAKHPHYGDLPVDDPRWTFGERIEIGEDGTLVRRVQLLPEDAWKRLDKAYCNTEAEWDEECWKAVVNEVNAILRELSAAPASEDLPRDIQMETLSTAMRQSREECDLLRKHVDEISAERNDWRHKHIIEAAAHAETIAELDKLKQTIMEASNALDDVLQLPPGIHTLADRIRIKLDAPRGRFEKSEATRLAVIRGWCLYYSTDESMLFHFRAEADRVIDALNALAGDDETEPLRAEVERLRKELDFAAGERKGMRQKIDEHEAYRSRLVAERDNLAKCHSDMSQAFLDAANARNNLTSELARLKAAWPEGMPKIIHYRSEANPRIRFAVCWPGDKGWPYVLHDDKGNAHGARKADDQTMNYLFAGPLTPTSAAPVDHVADAKMVGDVELECFVKRLYEVIDREATANGLVPQSPAMQERCMKYSLATVQIMADIARAVRDEK